MNIIKEFVAPKLTLDEILAISPTFVEAVEMADEDSDAKLDKAETLTKEAQSKMATADNLRKNATRIKNSVKKFRKITGVE